jgi:hypothetical protein
MDVRRARMTGLILKDAVFGSGRRGMRRLHRSRPMQGDVAASHLPLAAGRPRRFAARAAVLGKGSGASQ